MNKKEYKAKNLQFLQDLATQEDIHPLPGGLFYKCLEKGNGTISPTVRSIVTVYYKGSLIDGKVFDNSYENGYPEAFRLCDVIVGWQIALQKMHEGDRWIIYIPAERGYGSKPNDSIPGNSTLIFDVSLIKIA